MSHGRYSHLVDLLPQIITAAATLGGVVLTLIFTGRRESNRLEQQLAFERQKLLADERRLLFIKAAHAMQRAREHIVNREEEQAHFGREAWEDAVRTCTNALFTLETELLVVAPDVAPYVRQVARQARVIRDSPSADATKLPMFESALRDHIREAMETMRKVLGTEGAPPGRLSLRAVAGGDDV